MLNCADILPEHSKEQPVLTSLAFPKESLPQQKLTAVHFGDFRALIGLC